MTAAPMMSNANAIVDSVCFETAPGNFTSIFPVGKAADDALWPGVHGRRSSSEERVRPI
jgi:hypothetical protein